MENVVDLQFGWLLHLICCLSNPFNNGKQAFIFFYQALVYFLKGLELVQQQLYHQHLPFLVLFIVPFCICPFFNLLGSLMKACPCHILLFFPFFGHFVSRRIRSFIGSNKYIGSIQLSPLNNLKGTLTHGLSSLKVVEELSNVKEVCPIFLMCTHIVSQILL